MTRVIKAVEQPRRQAYLCILDCTHTQNQASEHVAQEGVEHPQRVLGLIAGHHVPGLEDL
jgi:hypothetical protein|eukprot:COSAG01_NODE_64_length_29509_cov_1035.985209_28_plen_60_part_00